MSELSESLLAFATAVGIAPTYIGWQGAPVAASQTTLIRLLAALGPGLGFNLPLDCSLADVQAAAAAYARQRASAGAPP
nr:hypothetical protein [Kofleriaceae bacterium]